MNNTLR